MTRLPAMPPLDALLADPRRVVEVPVEVAPELLDQLAVEIGRRETVRALLRERLRPTESAPADQLLDVDEAASRLGVKPDWLRRQRPPYRVELSPGIVRYSAQGIEQFIRDRRDAG